jgi:hypothetical protein
MASFSEQVQKALFNIGIGAAGVLTVVTVFLVKGVINSSSQTQKRSSRKKKDAKYIDIDDDILSRFSKAIQCETVSYGTKGSETPSSPEELLKLHAVIKDCKYLSTRKFINLNFFKNCIGLAKA